MSRFCPMFFFLEALLLCIVAVRDSVPTAIGPAAADSYQSLSQNQGLYNSSDRVVVLNVTNFKSTVYGSEQGWLVEFYNSWCGFCQRFAPTWKSLAHDIYVWRGIVAVAALDCADEDNNPLCREYEIMRYPEVRYFAPNENPTNLGVDVEKGKDSDVLRRNLIKRLLKEQQEGRGVKWPNITPFRSSEIKNIWEGVPEEAKYYFLIFQETDAYLASEVILDLRNVTSLTIRPVNSDNGPMCLMHKIVKFPSIVVYSRQDSKQEHLGVRVPTREGARNAIIEFMRLKGIDVSNQLITDELPKVKEPSLSTSVVTKKTIDIEIESHGSTKKFIADVLHQADLEATLRYSINHEIPMMKIIDGEKMRALKNYTNVLASYFPTKRGNPMFLNTINFATRSMEATSGADFAALVKSTERKTSPVYSEVNNWVGCRPSKVGTHGYPCGLWTLFHTLTVNFAARSHEHPDLEPTQVLGAIHGYVKNFFGCADCARHFIAMAAKNNIFGVNSADESVLWLWRAHNEVNERLAGDDTEDPRHPKIQYPSSEHCPGCREENGQWNNTEVLAYLKRKYSYSGIVYDSPRRSLSMQNSAMTGIINARLVDKMGTSGAKKIGWDFTIFDISICVVLYVTSAVILILVCIKFAVKRSHKRKMYVHSILGKV